MKPTIRNRKFKFAYNGKIESCDLSVYKSQDISIAIAKSDFILTRRNAILEEMINCRMYVNHMFMISKFHIYQYLPGHIKRIGSLEQIEQNFQIFIEP